MEKPEFVARAFKGFVRNEYDFYTFRRLAMAPERCLVVDFDWLRLLRKDREPPNHVALSLLAVGLVELESIPTIPERETTNKYKVTHLGKLFLQVVVEDGHRED